MKASNATSNRTAPAAGQAGTADSSSSTAERFRLAGRSLVLDARIHAYRKDIADIALAGHIFAPHYARPLIRGCGSRSAFVRSSPGAEEAVTEMLPGEEFAVLEYSGGWAWGHAQPGHVVGYVEAIALADPIRPTHIVCERCAPVAPDDRITSSIIATLPMGARLHGEESGACLSTEYGCVSLSHLRRIDDHDDDPVVVAERLIGVPFLPGGRSLHGIDGSGLVQLALGLCGIPAPRLLDQQSGLGTPLSEVAPCRRGDIILFDGGAGLMVDDLLMIHASRAAGKVTVEPVARIAEPIARRRLA